MIEFDNTSTRRLPVYIVLDTSGSMQGDGIEAVNQGVQLLVSELRSDPMALETAWISCITFDNDARLLLPLTEVGTAIIPPLKAGGMTSMGTAIRLLLTQLKQDLRPNTPSQKGDYKPLIFFMTDGNPTDNDILQLAAAELRENSTMRTANVIALGCGHAINSSVLKQITSTVLMMSDVTPDNIRSFFRWVSQSVKITSRSGITPVPENAVVNLPPPPPGIQVIL